MTQSPPSSAAHARLREAVLEHLWRQFPGQCLILTDPRSRHAIDVGIARGARYGFVTATALRPFVSLMVLLGSHFDEDPQIPWAAQSLSRSRGAPRLDAIDDLLAQTAAHMEPLVGQSGEYYRRALAWIGARSLDQLMQAYGDDADGLPTFLRHLYRRKLSALGLAGTAELLHASRVRAEHHGLGTPAGRIVILGLMALLGSAFDRDPFHPWAGDALASSGVVDPDARARALHARALEVLGRHTRLDLLSNTPAARA